MLVTISLGWWMIPGAMTAALVCFGFTKPPATSSGYGNIDHGLVEAIKMLLGLIACLVAWLIWAVLT